MNLLNITKQAPETTIQHCNVKLESEQQEVTIMVILHALKYNTLTTIPKIMYIFVNTYFD